MALIAQFGMSFSEGMHSRLTLDHLFNVVLSS